MFFQPKVGRIQNCENSFAYQRAAVNREQLSHRNDRMDRLRMGLGTRPIASLHPVSTRHAVWELLSLWDINCDQIDPKCCGKLCKMSKCLLYCSNVITTLDFRGVMLLLCMPKCGL